jgi:hypothetical protein
MTSSTVKAGAAAVSYTLPADTSPGSYTIDAVYNAGGFFNTSTGMGTLTIGKVTPTVTLSSSAGSVLAQTAVTFTASVSSPIGAPANGETVTFYDKTTSTALGQAAVTGGTATLTTSSMAVGMHSVTAMYSGDAEFNAATSEPVSELVEDFSLQLSTGSGSVTSVTTLPGGAAVFTFTISPVGASTFPAAVQLAATGLPAGATYTFAPSSLAAGSGAQTVTLTVQVPQTTASVGGDAVGSSGAPALAMSAGARPGGHSGGRGLIPYSLALVLLPFAGGLRRVGRKLGKPASLLLLILGVAAVAGITGCGTSGSGFFGQAAKTYTVTVTGTSGTLSHSTTVSLTVQ